MGYKLLTHNDYVQQTSCNQDSNNKLPTTTYIAYIPRPRGVKYVCYHNRKVFYD